MANTAINHDPAATFPGSSTDTAVVKWSGTGGKTLINSGVTIDSSNNVTVPGNITTTGYIHLTGDEKALRFYEGSNFISIAAPSGLDADYTLTLPINDGSADEFLQTNGSGVLVWAAAAGTTINSNADNRIITGSGTANTLNGEATLLYGSSALTLNSSNVTTAQLIVHGYGDGSTDGPGRISIRRSRTSTIGGNGTVTSGGDNIGIIEFAANDGDSVELGAAIRVNSTENWSNSARGNRMRIFTTANGSTSQVEAMRIDQNAEVTVKENNTLASVTKGIAKMWCSYAQAGSQSITRSYNVAGISDGGGAGDTDLTWTVNFENETGNVFATMGNGGHIHIGTDDSSTASGITGLITNHSGSSTDQQLNNIVGFGEAT